MKLYDLDISGNCYKVRLFCALLNKDVELVPMDLSAGEHKEPPFIDINPWGEVPVLQDGDFVLRDAQAILVYLARKYGGNQWWPDSAAHQADVVQWLSVAAHEIQHGPNAARLVDKFGAQISKERALSISDKILSLLEKHLTDNQWLALSRPTIAECAIYPYLAVAWEGGIDLSPYKAINSWMDRVKELPGYKAMPGIK